MESSQDDMSIKPILVPRSRAEPKTHLTSLGVAPARKHRSTGWPLTSRQRRPAGAAAAAWGMVGKSELSEADPEDKCEGKAGGRNHGLGEGGPSRAGGP